MKTTNLGPYAGKRIFDGVTLIVVSVPAFVVGLVCALAVKVTSRGPVFFVQERVGMNGNAFRVWKFRTMVVGVNPVIPDESRITSAGRWLRRYSLDELPQLINVARGEMSIVGPRPTLAYQVERYSDHQRLRLSVPPGLTGLAQVSGRNALTWHERIEWDINYVKSQSVATDLRILLRTASAVLSGEGTSGHATDDPLSAPDDSNSSDSYNQ